ncbi:Na(+)/H(+) antiporter subunit F1 [Metabacillus fastidiosus]|uniref:Na(+)/H(+) antiporter subunit F1 n=1 Tax=Metabacillus fastidiosus TaxID=1458 RepID=A0ABU6P1Y9_9BACI|nr:Na(+)/H(+) antiporter subunit F1 [Metabacillus fastidiosus]MED4403018.1 Na(+)/H(+) antiporter subunit F1 [Metabacillus fastidiosus]MED4461436.1 Na(+)/H(+) antiporter subunit F1 [Metabacillus fastidiosus]MED4533829.1 Na(+)/H(+) antiporter subunit F1 [Metabacillus fastidiosus]
MFTFIMTLSLFIIAVSTALYLYRLIKGPSTPDRVIALDAIGINLIGITAVTLIVLNTNAFVEVILLISILAFIGTVAFAKFLEKGEIVENDRDQ